MNRIVLIGRLTQDPTVRYTNTGIAVADLRVASDSRYRDRQGERETVFINVVAWRKMAELCGQYLTKGRQVAVDGSLRMRTYQTPQGENRTVYEIVADNVQFLGRGPGEPAAETAPPTSEEAPPTPSEMDQDDDLPF